VHPYVSHPNKSPLGDGRERDDGRVVYDRCRDDSDDDDSDDVDGGASRRC
jgi:hypothetical protein